jgi:hypothetical protein
VSFPHDLGGNLGCESTRFPIEAFGNDKTRNKEITMDLIYLGITAALLLMTWGLMKICEVPADGSKPLMMEEKHPGGKS